MLWNKTKFQVQGIPQPTYDQTIEIFLKSSTECTNIVIAQS